VRYEIILADEVNSNLCTLLLSLRRNVKACALRTTHVQGSGYKQSAKSR
jgi:hypothetical protein